MPVVSIIVPCYNQEKYISECLDSVLQQSFTDFECIVVNDGSTDDSLVLISEFIKNDARFRLLNQRNQGLANSRNNGIKIAKGKFILPLDGDDLIDRNYIESAIHFFNLNEDYSVVYCLARYFGNKEGKMPLEKYSYRQLLKGNCIFCSALFKKSEYDITKGYDFNLIYGYEDWDFWLQLLDENSKVHRIEKELFYYRQSENSMISFTKDTYKLNFTMNYIFNKHKEVYLGLLSEKKKNMIDVIRDIQENEMLTNKITKIKKSISYKVFYKLERLFFK